MERAGAGAPVFVFYNSISWYTNIMKTKEKVILVDKNDRVIGSEEKIKAHQAGILHRAFSILVFNSKKELLLQKRQKTKYHCPGLWSNTCCSHPRPGETLQQATHRRLKEEMGFDCRLKQVFSFIYKAKFNNGLTENEYDHVFIGRFDGQPKPDKAEVDSWKWTLINEFKKDILKNSRKYTPWLKIIVKEYSEYLKV